MEALRSTIRNNKSRIMTGAYIALILIITLSVFKVSFDERKPWFGTLSEWHHQWLSAGTLEYAKNWYNDGILKDKFTLFDLPKSIETSTPEERSIYNSYPPGFVFPIYALGKIAGQEPTPALLMSFDLFNHFCIAFFLAISIFLFLLGIGFNRFFAFVLGLIPIFLTILLPMPFYFLQNVYGPDQAVLLPVVLFIFFEVLRDIAKSRKALLIIGILQGLIAFYGMSCDWLFLFVAFVVYLKRLFNTQSGDSFKSWLKKSFQFWLPIILPGIAFLLQTYINNGFGRLLFKYRERTGYNDPIVSNFFNTFWKEHIPSGYGEIAIYLIFGSLFIFGICFVFMAAFRKFNPTSKKLMNMVAIYLVPFFLQIYFFREHSLVHDFSALKFTIVLAVVPFILIPLLALSVAGVDFNLSMKSIKYKLGMYALIMALTGSALFYVYNVHPKYEDLFLDPEPRFAAVGDFFVRNTKYEDVVFSTNFEIPKAPPHQIAMSMKAVYKVNSTGEIYDKVKNLSDDCIIDIFKIDSDVGGNNNLYKLTKLSYKKVAEKNKYFLYKIKKKDFMNYIKTNGL